MNAKVPDQTSMKLLNQKVDYLIRDITTINNSVGEIKSKLENHYVTKEEFDLKMKYQDEKIASQSRIIWLVGSAIILSVIGAILSQVLKR